MIICHCVRYNMAHTLISSLEMEVRSLFAVGGGTDRVCVTKVARHRFVVVHK